MILAVVLAVSLTACGGNNGENESRGIVYEVTEKICKSTISTEGSKASFGFSQKYKRDSAVLIIGCDALVGTAVYGKRKKRSAK